MSYSKEIASRITRFLDNDDWRYSLNEEKEIITMNLTLSNKMKKVEIMIDLRDDKFFVYMTYPLGAEKAERPEVVDLINRINYNLMFGCFEMDNRDGEIRFRMPVDCDNCMPSQEVIKHAIYRSAATCKKYGDAFAQVIMGFGTGEEAYKKAQEQD